LKRLIEDKKPFNKEAYVKIMKLIPQKIFAKDDIQRIGRFVKQHESITERDYLDAIELAGHVFN
jgi:hypothetical protein